jgi:plastocyanin
MGVPNIAALVLVLVGCGTRATPVPPSSHNRSAYVPRTRAVTITTVPLLVKELVKTYPFLERDFAAGGVLAGKEVYAFSPSTITAVSGDTLRLTLLNPEDDDHGFVLRDFFVKLPPQSRIDTTYVVKAPGIYDFSCSVPAHLPMMHGQLVVMSADQAPAPFEKATSAQIHSR